MQGFGPARMARGLQVRSVAPGLRRGSPSPHHRPVLTDPLRSAAALGLLALAARTPGAEALALAAAGLAIAAVAVFGAARRPA